MGLHGRPSTDEAVDSRSSHGMRNHDHAGRKAVGRATQALTANLPAVLVRQAHQQRLAWAVVLSFVGAAVLLLVATPILLTLDAIATGVADFSRFFAIY